MLRIHYHRFCRVTWQWEGESWGVATLFLSSFTWLMSPLTLKRCPIDDWCLIHVFWFITSLPLQLNCFCYGLLIYSMSKSKVISGHFYQVSTWARGEAYWRHTAAGSYRVGRLKLWKLKTSCINKQKLASSKGQRGWGLENNCYC